MVLLIYQADDAAVYEDYACMLNQTNISANNNKFYVIQLLCQGAGAEYVVWTRWGRVVSYIFIGFFTSELITHTRTHTVY